MLSNVSLHSLSGHEFPSKNEEQCAHCNEKDDDGNDRHWLHLSSLYIKKITIFVAYIYIYIIINVFFIIKLFSRNLSKSEGHRWVIFLDCVQ